MIRQFRANEPLLLPAIQALRRSIDDYATRPRQGRSTQATLVDLTAALMGAGKTAEVMSYLRSRIADWDVSPWHPNQQAQSAVERRLRVRTVVGERPLMIRRSRPRRQWRASGCSWCLAAQGRARRLARRYAQSRAQAALSQLEHGASLDEVELPLLTTWDRWTKTPGSTRKSLVTASFASGLGHTDPDGSGHRPSRAHLYPAGHASAHGRGLLDEAADFAGQPPGCASSTRYRDGESS